MFGFAVRRFAGCANITGQFEHASACHADVSELSVVNSHSCRWWRSNSSEIDSPQRALPLSPRPGTQLYFSQSGNALPGDNLISLYAALVMYKLTRRRVLGSMVAVGGLYGLGLATPITAAYAAGDPLRRAVNSVLKSAPLATGLDLAKPVAKLLQAGAIDPGKFLGIYKNRGPVPEWVSLLLQGRQQEQELILSLENAPFNLNLLWPIGLATKTTFNDESPIGGARLPYFASTGGWTLGRKNNGAAYFNKVETLSLSPEQSSLARRAAENIFRPCCGNSAFYQDCNHGSAMLGLIEMAASSGQDSESIMQFAKVANGLWYPRNYVETAIFFDAIKGTSWEDVPAALVLSSRFSSIGGWRANVRAALLKKGLRIRSRQGAGGGGSCAA